MRNAMRPHCEPHMPIADATDGRTDGTKKSHPIASKAKACNAHARDGGMATVGELIDAGSWLRTPERHEVIRHGEREPIPSHVRSAVFYRDRGRCELCDWEHVTGPWHLDHIKPWSAGGSDTSDNLRVLCEEHNQKRSNHVDPLERRRRPVTWWCVHCYDGGNVWTTIDGLPICPWHHMGRRPDGMLSTRCRVTGAYLRALEAGEPLPDWHARGPLENADRIAYCAHCNLAGLTDVTL